MQRCSLVLISIALVAIAGCGNAGDFPVAPVSGTITCDGVPVAHAVVYFERLQGGADALVGKQGIGRADENGKYVVSTYGDGDGAVIGKHRVRVGAPNPDMHPGFTCACDTNPEKDVMEVEVEKGEKNVFDVVLARRAVSTPLSLEEAEAREEAAQAARENRTP